MIVFLSLNASNYTPKRVPLFGQYQMASVSSAWRLGMDE
jgi:hypothetical protein